MAILKAFITYDGLPIKSGGAHHLKSKSPKSIHNSLLAFFDNYTGDLGADSNIELLEFKIRDVIKYSFKFGIPNFNWSNFLANGQKLIHWKTPNEKTAFYIDHDFDWDYLRLTILWRFKFKDENTGKILPWQDRLPELDFRRHNSQLYLRLSGQESTVSAWFAFPFSDLTEENMNYIKGIQDTLPFKFSKSSWRLWQLSKNRQWHPSKMDVI